MLYIAHGRENVSEDFPVAVHLEETSCLSCKKIDHHTWGQIIATNDSNAFFKRHPSIRMTALYQIFHVESDLQKHGNHRSEMLPNWKVSQSMLSTSLSPQSGNKIAWRISDLPLLESDMLLGLVQIQQNQVEHHKDSGPPWTQILYLTEQTQHQCAVAAKVRAPDGVCHHRSKLLISLWSYWSFCSVCIWDALST